MKKLRLFLFSVLLSLAGTAFAETNSPEISYFSSGSELTIEIQNVNREDVQTVLWDNTDVSSFLEELEVAGELSVTDTEDGFTIVINPAPELDGEFSLQLANGIKVTAPIQHSVDQDEGGLRRGISLPTVQVTGKVRYKESGCWFWRCYKSANGATITVKGTQRFGLGVTNANATTKSNGYYDTGKLDGCGKFTVTAKYNGKTKSSSKSPSCTVTGNKKYTINFDIK
jgi:hypothetical protein